MTEGIPEWPYADCPVPIVDRDHNFSARPSERTMDSGRVRRRRTQSEMQEFLRVRWSLTDDQFEAFLDFFELTLVNGQGSFLMKTFEPSPTSEFRSAEVQWELAFVGAQGGYTYTRGDNNVQVTANLEVVDKTVVETNPLPFITFGYFHDEGPTDNNPTVEGNPSDCRENVSVLLDNLLIGAIYLLVIGDSADGPWTPYIYFSLQTPEEQSTLHKRVTMNNDFGGLAFFRVKMFKNTSGVQVDAFMTQAGAPLASVLSAPVVTIANMSELTTSAQQVALELARSTSTDGLRPLAFYQSGNWVIPYSFVEDPLVFTSRTYRAFKKKYVLKQWAWGGIWGDLIAAGSFDQPVTATGPVGATVKWTRDGSIPTETTPDPLTYHGVANNAYAADDAFCGMIKARAFKDGCRSPLTIICIDKLMLERSNLKTFGNNHDIVADCDLPQVDPVSGHILESGNSCNVVYGGECAFEDLIYGEGTSGGGIANSTDDPSGHGPLFRFRVKTLTDGTYLGWPIHQVVATYYEFASSTWNGVNFNGWTSAFRNHNWAITTLGNIFIGENQSLAGPVGGIADTDRAAWDFFRDQGIIGLLPPVPDPVCGGTLSLFIYADRFDIIRTPLWWDEPRDTYWLGISSPAAIPSIPTESIPADPVAPAALVLPYDDFSIYIPGDASTQSLNFHTGTDWDASWTVRDGTAQIEGWDTFDDYLSGTVPDYSTSHHTGDGYIYFSKGEAWDPGATLEWHITSPETGIIYQGEDWSAYSVGALPFQAGRNVGSAWTVDEGWMAGTTFIQGSETWSTYADGIFVGSASGDQFLISESWIAR